MRPPVLLALLLPACNVLTGIDAYQAGQSVEHPADAEEAATTDAASADGSDVVSIEGSVEGSADGGALDSAGGPEVDAAPDTTPDIFPPPDAGCLTHRNGMPGGTGTYTFCAPLGTPGVASTYSLAMAEAARASAGALSTGGTAACGTFGAALACVKTVWGYATWGYAGPIAGYMYVDPSACTACPTTLAPTWD